MHENALEVMFLAQNFALNIPTLTDDLSSVGFHLLLTETDPVEALLG